MWVMPMKKRVLLGIIKNLTARIQVQVQVQPLEFQLGGSIMLKFVPYNPPLQKKNPVFHLFYDTIQLVSLLIVSCSF